MFSKKTVNTTPTITETIIGKGARISGGTLSGISSVRVDGEFLGTIDIDGDLILGESGSIEGNIRARSAMIAGYTKSPQVVCKESLHIVSTGTIYGDIQVGSLIVDEEGVFIGNCKMIREGAQEPPAGGSYGGELYDVTYSGYEER